MSFVQELSFELNTQVNEYQKLAEESKPLISSREFEEFLSILTRVKSKEIKLIAFGEINAGKSTLLNRLFDPSGRKKLFEESPTPATWGRSFDGLVKEWKSVEGFTICLQDTPGLGANDQTHYERALSLANASDVVMFVMEGTVKGDEQLSAIKHLVNTGSYLVLVVNKVDTKRTEEIDENLTYVFNRVPDLEKAPLFKVAANPLYGECRIWALQEHLVELVRKSRDALLKDLLNRHGGLFEKLVAGRLQSKIEEERKQVEAQRAENIRRSEGKLYKCKEEIVPTFAISGATTASVLPLSIDILVTPIATGGMLLAIANEFKVFYDEDSDEWVQIDSHQNASENNLVGKMIKSFLSVFFVNTAAMITFKGIATAAKTNPATYLAGVAIDFAFTFFLISSVGQAYAVYCSQGRKFKDEDQLNRIFKEFIQENVEKKFLQKLPKRFREKIKELLNI